MLCEDGAVGWTSSEIQTYLFPKELAQWHGSRWWSLLCYLFGGIADHCLLLGCRLRGFCTLLGCLWLLRGRDIFVWFYRGNRLLFNALEGITNTETIGNVRRTRYSSKFRHPLVQETSTQQTTIAQDTQGKKVQLQICVPVPFKWVSWTEETDYMATHPL